MALEGETGLFLCIVLPTSNLHQSSGQDLSCASVPVNSVCNREMISTFTLYLLNYLTCFGELV